jgi:hypothetical protein
MSEIHGYFSLFSTFFTLFSSAAGGFSPQKVNEVRLRNLENMERPALRL